MDRARGSRTRNYGTPSPWEAARGFAEQAWQDITRKTELDRLESMPKDEALEIISYSIIPYIMEFSGGGAKARPRVTAEVKDQIRKYRASGMSYRAILDEMRNTGRPVSHRTVKGALLEKGIEQPSASQTFASLRGPKQIKLSEEEFITEMIKFRPILKAIRNEDLRQEATVRLWRELNDNPGKPKAFYKNAIRQQLSSGTQRGRSVDTPVTTESRKTNYVRLHVPDEMTTEDFISYAVQRKGRFTEDAIIDEVDFKRLLDTFSPMEKEYALYKIGGLDDKAIGLKWGKKQANMSQQIVPKLKQSIGTKLKAVVFGLLGGIGLGQAMQQEHYGRGTARVRGIR